MREQLKRERRVLAVRATKILLTTTPTIEGRRVVDYLGIESVEIVMGTGFLSELTSELSDFAGRRSTMCRCRMLDVETHCQA